MRRLLGLVCVLLWAWLAWAADSSTPEKKKSVPKKSVRPTASASKKAGSPAASKRTTTSKNSKKGTTSRRVSSARSRQTAPTPERYKEIQEALSAKGYLPSQSANGKWDDASAAALKKFQADQKIDASGKINSLSLIALGLGPKHDAAAKPVPPPAP